MNIKTLFPTDKLLHFLAGTYIFLFANLILTDLYALGVVVLIGALTELYDKLSKKGNAEFLDFLCTFIGGFMTLVLSKGIII